MYDLGQIRSFMTKFINVENTGLSRPRKGLPVTWNKMPQIQDDPFHAGQLATLPRTLYERCAAVPYRW